MYRTRLIGALLSFETHPTPPQGRELYIVMNAKTQRHKGKEKSALRLCVFAFEILWNNEKSFCHKIS